MKKLTVIILLPVLLLAQSANPDVLYFTPDQTNRLTATMPRITVAQKELEAALEVQKRVIAEIRAELSAPMAKYGQPIEFDGKIVFKKIETKDSAKPSN